MSSTRSQSQFRIDQDIKSVLMEAGYVKPQKIGKTLQGMLYIVLNVLLNITHII